jgi:PIN domain nuclease of toxin-antitoxin system
VNLLLDTHVWVWSQEDPERLGPEARSSLLDESHQLFISATSSLELARLHSMDRIRLKTDIEGWVERAIRLLGAARLDITHQVAIEAYRLPMPFHRDPADRLLVATARIHELRLLTADDLILAYPAVASVDARR